MKTLEVIARIENAYTSKFGVPRQSGIVDEVVSRIVFEPAYRVEEALRGIGNFSHIWLIWGFHEAKREGWTGTAQWRATVPFSVAMAKKTSPGTLSALFGSTFPKLPVTPMPMSAAYAARQASAMAAAVWGE